MTGLKALAGRALELAKNNGLSIVGGHCGPP
jgi:hypothetical protein